MKSLNGQAGSFLSSPSTTASSAGNSQVRMKEESEACASPDITEKWYYISDAHVTEVNVAKVLKVQAYILFYERIK